MALVRLVSTVALNCCLLAAPALALDQRELLTGRLPPITRDYQIKIADWSSAFFASGASALAGARLSSPLLTRDGTGRLLWLVCLEAPAAGPDPGTGGVQRHAFGFAPNYFTAPQERRRATLSRAYCDERPLAWHPFASRVRVARRR